MRALFWGSSSDNDAAAIEEGLGLAAKEALLAIDHQDLNWADNRNPACQDGRAQAPGGPLPGIVGVAVESPCCVPHVCSIEPVPDWILADEDKVATHLPVGS